MQASLHAQFRLLFCRETLLTWGTKASQCALRHAKPSTPRAQTLVLWGWVPFGIFAGLPTVALGGTAFALPFVFAFAFAGAFAAGPRRAPLR